MSVSELLAALPQDAVGLQLYRIDRADNLIACEPMRFLKGRSAVATTLRRAQLSGRVEIGGDILNHFADVLNDAGDMVETVALDSKSYGALKNRWMRCKVEHSDEYLARASQRQGEKG